jgi:hypothetical protein
MIVLKSKISGYYFKRFGVWTSHAQDAFAFPDKGFARDFIQNQRLVDVQVVEIETRNWADAFTWIRAATQSA